MLLVGAVWAWPADTAWVPVTLDEVGMTDTFEDQTGDRALDLVGSVDDSMIQWASDGETLWWRLRLNTDPSAVEGGWGLAFELNQDTFDLEAVLAASSDGGVQFLLPVEEVEGADVGLSAVESYEDAWRVEPANTTFRGDADSYLDVALPVADLYGHFEEVDDQWVFCVLPMTGDDPALERLTADLGTGSDLEGLHALDGSWSDPFAVDFDIDGLTRAEELALGSDPRDRDTDDDGLVDGHEVELGADPTVCHSDGDGVLDGIEMAVVERDVGTLEDSECWVLDADPETSTDPANPDSDGGGLLDGQEDYDANGRIDDLELDPNLASDDLDSDADGVPDVLEADCTGDVLAEDSDADGISDLVEGVVDPDDDGQAAFCDEEADGDGIEDLVETAEDVDLDGVGNFLDLDSDGDGKPDADEGTGDNDGDEVMDFVDADDEDGPLGDPDGDGLSNQDEAGCGSDPEDPDSDGDGLLDGEESCREDADCDGKPDLHDATDDGFCEGGGGGGPGPEACEGCASGAATGCASGAATGCASGAGAGWLLVLTAASASLRRRRSRRSCS